MQKPEHLFDREWEWEQLARFVADERPGATLGVVSGRRRQGKSILLHAIAEQTAGFYYEAIDGSEQDILRDLGTKLAAWSDAPAPFTFASSEQALDALGRARAGQQPHVVVLDEFPALASANASLPSLVRNWLGASTRTAGSASVRLLLCGSALSFMGGLLAGQSPLRGRAGLELVVRSFDFRTARAFWELDDLALAARVFAIVGGTPAYRREFVADDVPKGARDFDAWVCRTAMNPSCPLFREVRYLLAEDPAIGDLALYHSVLAAIAAGETSSARIASRLGRPATALGHPLNVLADAGFVLREQDAFHQKRVHYAITEPLVEFHHAILRPWWSELERPGRARDVWQRSQATWKTQVLGPAFEAMCRSWVRDHAAPSTFGQVSAVRRALVPDAEQQKNHELDVVVLGERNRVLAIGEVKWEERMGNPDVERLRRVLGLLATRGHDTSDARVACFSSAGFSSELQREAREGRVVLVDLERLYGGE